MSQNDPTPTGTPTYQGSFASGDATGTATVYSQGLSSYVVQLAGFSCSGCAGALVIAIVGGQPYSGGGLTSTSGNLNFTITGAPSTSWSKIELCNSTTCNATVYATALLTAIN